MQVPGICHMASFRIRSYQDILMFWMCTSPKVQNLSWNQMDTWSHIQASRWWFSPHLSWLLVFPFLLSCLSPNPSLAFPRDRPQKDRPGLGDTAMHPTVPSQHPLRPVFEALPPNRGLQASAPESPLLSAWLACKEGHMERISKNFPLFQKTCVTFLALNSEQTHGVQLCLLVRLCEIWRNWCNSPLSILAVCIIVYKCSNKYILTSAWGITFHLILHGDGIQWLSHSRGTALLTGGACLPHLRFSSSLISQSVSLELASVWRKEVQEYGGRAGSEAALLIH